MAANVTAAVALAFGELTTMPELAELGVRRISVGGALARTAWTGFLDAARRIAGKGSFSGLAVSVSAKELNGLMAGGLAGFDVRFRPA